MTQNTTNSKRRIGKTDQTGKFMKKYFYVFFKHIMNILMKK